MLYPLSYGGPAAAGSPPAVEQNGATLPAPTPARDHAAGRTPGGQAPRRRPAPTTGRGPGGSAPVTQGLGRVLVVDDDEVIRQLIAVNLTLEGFDVTTAIDGQDCLDKVRAIDPDVITLDVMMPRLDGWETAVQLRKAPHSAHIKVVLITARAQEDDMTRG